jgi:hypothetical protein
MASPARAAVFAVVDASTCVNFSNSILILCDGMPMPVSRIENRKSTPCCLCKQLQPEPLLSLFSEFDRIARQVCHN